ncbi:MAG TPA: class I SAM-dependent methyltransferase, partial [Rhodobacterales bacterium]|nr:class I SAM-dependent methyltransferase [Rhodobacterales bacterium]
MMDARPTALPDPENVVATYQVVAADYARARSRALTERRWLDRALNHAPGRDVLDIGCGAGRPIATYLAERRCRMTGVDGADAMCDLYQQALPSADVYHADMRSMDIPERFDLLLAWDSLFHLTPADQQATLGVFARHARPRAVLLFTAGPQALEGAGMAAGAQVYHASLSPEGYTQAL